MLIWLKLFAAVILLLVIQDGFIVGFSNQIFYANLALVFLVISVFLGSLKEALSVAILIGFVFDFNSGLIDGILTASTLVVFGFLLFLSQRVITREVNLKLLHGLVFASVCVYYLGVSFLIFLIEREIYFLPLKFALDILITSAFTYPIYWFYSQVTRA